MRRLTRGLLACAAAAAPLRAQHVRTLESSRLLRDSAPVAVRLQLGTGTLSLGASDAPYLYRSITRFSDAFSPPASAWNAAQRTLTLTAGARHLIQNASTSTDDHDASVQDWRVQLTRRAPLQLSIDATAAKASLDLTGLPLRRFALNTGAAAATVRFDAPNPESMTTFDASVGAGGLQLIGLGNAGASEARIIGGFGDLSLDLGGRWQRDMQIAVTSSIGGITIVAPPTIGIELDVGGVLKRADVTGEFNRTGSRWRSANYEASAIKVQIFVKSVIGKLELIQR